MIDLAIMGLLLAIIVGVAGFLPNNHLPTQRDIFMIFFFVVVPSLVFLPTYLSYYCWKKLGARGIVLPASYTLAMNGFIYIAPESSHNHFTCFMFLHLALAFGILAALYDTQEIEDGSPE